MNKYLVIGKAHVTGAIGVPEDFQIEHTAENSKDAYQAVRNGLYADNHDSVLVIAIKMKCEECSSYHLTVPTNLYLY